MIDYRELLKKFIFVAGEAEGLSYVLLARYDELSIKFSDEEKAELFKLESEAFGE